jgi:hypothetical protein
MPIKWMYLGCTPSRIEPSMTKSVDLWMFVTRQPTTDFLFTALSVFVEFERFCVATYANALDRNILTKVK